MSSKRKKWTYRFQGAFASLILVVLGNCVAAAIQAGTECSRFFIVENWNRSDLESMRTNLLVLAEAAIQQQRIEFGCDCLKNASEISGFLGDPERALDLLDKARLLEQTYKLSSVAETHAMFALLYHHSGAKASSDNAVEAALEALPDVVDADRRGLILTFLGDAYYSRQEIEPLLESYRSALKLFHETGNSKGEARIQTNLAYAEMVVDNLQQAHDAANMSYALSKEIGDRRRTAIALVALARVNFRSGAIRESLVQALEAVSLFPDDADRTERAFLLYGLGELNDHLGDCDQARLNFTKTLALLNEDKNISLSIGVLWSLAAAEIRCGKVDDSARTLKTAISLAKDLGKNDDLAVALLRSAEVESMNGDTDAALISLKSASQLPGLTDYNRARIESGLGQLYLTANAVERADVHLQAALVLNERIGHTIELGDNLHRLARASLARGKIQEARRYAERSIEVSDRISLSLDSRRLRSQFFAASDERYRTLIEARNAAGGISDPANLLRGFDIAELSRGRQMRAAILSNGTATANPRNVSESAELRAQLSAKGDALTDLISRNASDEVVESIEREMGELERQLESLLPPHHASLHAELTRFSFDELQRSLSADDVIVSYVLAERESYLWLIGADRFETLVLPSRQSIQSSVDRLLGSIEERRRSAGESLDQYRTRIANLETEAKVAARELSDMILGPVADRIKGKRLIVVPDGKLNYFPISALPMPGSGSDDPILLTNEVIYQPSAQTYALLKKIGQERKDERKKDLLVFSDPVFNPADERLTGIEVAADKSDEPYRFRLVESFSSLSRLPASKTEAETVSNAVGGSDLFMGFDATRDRLLSTNLADYRVVHLATHGFLDPERPELSSLVLSRYDQTGKQIDESIRMHDIYSMKLNADLVVLSACETGTGKEIKGEGVMGLNTAFLQAGARSVVSTLWQVEDNAANELMKEFYGRMVSDGMSPSAALRAAQIKLYNDPQFRSPFFWAAFTVHGDAASSTPFERDNSRFAIGIAAAILFGLILLIFGRQRTSKV